MCGLVGKRYGDEGKRTLCLTGGGRQRVGLAEDGTAGLHSTLRGEVAMAAWLLSGETNPLASGHGSLGRSGGGRRYWDYGECRIGLQGKTLSGGHYLALPHHLENRCRGHVAVVGDGR